MILQGSHNIMISDYSCGLQYELKLLCISHTHNYQSYGLHIMPLIVIDSLGGRYTHINTDACLHRISFKKLGAC